MTFITQPTKEGETKDCDNCGDKIVARLKVYKDYDNKIQWQDEKETKAHYDKDGNCNGSTTTKPETVTQETTQETTTITNVTGEPVTEKAILEAILHVLVDIKKLLENKN